MKGITCSIFIFLSFTLVKGQEITFKNVECQINGTNSEIGFIGGINNPQFSNIDFNRDGNNDIFIFDSNGQVIIPLIHDGDSNSSNFIYSSAYKNVFPPLEKWALLRDFDGDGVMDIFCHSYGTGIEGVRVWKGSYINDELKYSSLPINSGYFLTFNSDDGDILPIFISQYDLPSIEDIDGDGDIDILSFDKSGARVNYYRNMSIEESLDPSSFKFVLEDDCWGKFQEGNVSDSIYLSEDMNECFNFKLSQPKHVGSTLLAIDLDGDHDKDLLLGDLNSKTINALINNGSLEAAWCNEVIHNFPISKPINFNGYLSVFYIDINNDEVRDLVISPRYPNFGRNKDHIWAYINVNTDESPEFEYLTDNFIVDKMINMGAFTSPKFIDFNRDDLIDIIVGCNAYTFDDNTNSKALFILENIGTKEVPKYAVSDSNFLNLNQYSNISISPVPSFGDLDHDGDIDIILGSETGFLEYFENISDTDTFSDFFLDTSRIINYRIGHNIYPIIEDINLDDKLDIIVGESNNALNYFENIGTNNKMKFISDPTIAPNTDNLGYIFSNSTELNRKNNKPCIFNSGYKRYLMLAFGKGNIELYTIPMNAHTDEFTLENNNYGNISEGENINIDIADIDNDNLYELVIGNTRGGISFYDTELPVEAKSEINSITNSEVKIVNPVKENIQILNLPFPLTASLFAIDGRFVKELSFEENGISDVAFLPMGIYWIRLKHKGYKYYKIIKL